MHFHGLNDPDEETIISFDFWDTVILNEQSPGSRWIKTMEILKEEFDLELDAITYENWFHKISNSIRRLNQENNSDYEYRGERAWAYFSALIFSNLSERIKFQKRAVEIYFQIANANTELNVNFKKFFSKAHSHPEHLIITSDFEFGRDHIYKLLIEKGIDFPKKNIFVSSDFLMTKYSGRLFNNLQEIFPDKKIIHVGDDLKSDYIMAKKSGVGTLFRAKISTTIYRKIKYHKEKRFSQLKKIPFRLPIFKNDINLLRSVLVQFEIFVRKNLEENDSVLFLGSEGAFFSNLFSDEFHSRFSTRCVNLGRKEILKKIFAFDSDFVISILLLEEFSINEIMRYLNSFYQISIDELMDAINLESVFNKAKTQISEANFYAKEINQIYKTDGRLVALDIGYKATFAMCLSRLMEIQILALQLLGFKQIQKKSNLEVKSLQELDVPKYGRAFSTKFLESLLGTGPRSEFSNNANVLEIQRKIIENKDTRNIKVSRLVGFSRFPSRRIRSVIFRERLDDLRMEEISHEYTHPA